MREWLTQLTGQLGDITEEQLESASSTLSEIQEGEEIVGEAPEEFRRLYALHVQMSRNLRRTAAALLTTECACENCEHAQLNTNMARMENDLEIISSIMWRSARLMTDNEFDQIGVRKDWKIVKTMPSALNPILNLVMGLR